MAKAIESYVEILDGLDGKPELTSELALFNKVGDLYLKVSKVQDAVEMYERAVSLYAEQGFPNNAIALCNKILRNAPGRTPIYLKLAQLMVERGFVAEAKQNLLEYAERMQKAGKTDEAFRALKDFADLSPDNEEIRLLLAEQLKAAARDGEAREQLEKLYAESQGSGDQRRSRATLDNIKAIDPNFDEEKAPKPKASPQRGQKSSELVFLDIEYDTDAATAAPTVPVAPIEIEPTAMAEPEVIEEDVLAPLEIEDATVAGSADVGVSEVDAIAGLDSGLEFAAGVEEAEALELEPTSLVEAEPETAEAPEFAPLDLEPTSLSEAEPEPELLELEPAALAEPELEPEPEPAPEPEPVAVQPAPVEDVAEPMELEYEDVPGLEAASEPDMAIQVPDLDLDDEGLELDEAELEIPEVSAEFEIVGEDRASVPDLPLIEVEAELDVEAPQAVTPEFEEIEDEGLVLVEADVAADVIEFAPAEAVAGPPDLATLEAAVAADPDDPASRVAYGEALIEQGDRARGIEELATAVGMFEAAEEWQRGAGLVDEILRVDPNSVRFHQKRVELTFRLGDRNRLVESYLSLADALFRDGQVDRSRAVYERVLEHDEDNARALEALQTLKPDEAAPAPAPAPVPVPAGGGDFIDLGALIMDDEPQRDTRMRVDDEEPTGDEDRDFADMLAQFKRGIEANLDEDDWQAHYDLGVAFKEMGLLDEAIAEFQKALRSAAGRLRTAEALGACFYEKGQYSVAATVMRRAVEADPGGDEAKIGLLYWLARCEEEQERIPDALVYYNRVFALDINFADVGDRVKQLAKAGG
ncbi:MAG TPA: tetratricopeptide repeat protein [Gemmatimonadales bacterium]